MSLDIYTKDSCPVCKRAKELLDSENIIYREIDVTHDSAKEAEMIKRGTERMVPQIFLNGHLLGGFDELSQIRGKGGLKKALRAKELDILLEGN